MLDRVLGGAAILGFMISLAIYSVASQGVDVIALYPAIKAMHVLCLGMVAMTLVFGRAPTGRNFKLRDFFPPWAAWLLRFGIVFAVGNFLLLVVSTDGVPEARGDGYVLRTHHGVYKIAEQEFHKYDAYVARGFSAFWMFGFFASALVFLARKENADP